MIRSTLRHIWKQCLRYRPYIKNRQPQQSPPAAIGSIPHVPDELLGIVVSYLAYNHQIRLRRISRRWRCVLQSPLAQQQIIFRYHPCIDWDKEDTGDNHQRRDGPQNNTAENANQGPTGNRRGTDGNNGVGSQSGSTRKQQRYTLKEYARHVSRSLAWHGTEIKAVIFDGQQSLAARFKPTFLAADLAARCLLEQNDRVFEDFYCAITAAVHRLHRVIKHFTGTPLVIKFVNLAISRPEVISNLFEKIGWSVRLQNSIIILRPDAFAGGWQEKTSETFLEWVKECNRCDAVYEAEYEVVYMLSLDVAKDLPSNIACSVLNASELANLTGSDIIEPTKTCKKVVSFRRVNSPMMVFDCKLAIYDKAYNIPIKEIVYHGFGFRSQS